MDNPKPPMRLSYRYTLRELGWLAAYLEQANLQHDAMRTRAQARKMLDHAEKHAGQPLRLECADAFRRGYRYAPTISAEQKALRHESVHEVTDNGR